MDKKFTLKAPAKINLGLTVISRRADGFHDLESVMQQVSLADTLLFEPALEKGWHFFCTEESISGLDNLVVRAASMLEERADRPLPGVKITLYKNIPVEAGLAGGSTDCAATLVGLNHFWNLGFERDTLQEMSLLLGSDIPFCLQGGTALARGRGEKLEKLPSLPFFWAILILPAGLRMPTATVYRNLNQSRLGEPLLSDLIEAIRAGERGRILDWLSCELTNTLETAVVPGSGFLQEIKSKLQARGLKPVLSGSGPALFMLAENYERACKMARMAEEENCRAYLCWTL